MAGYGDKLFTWMLSDGTTNCIAADLGDSAIHGACELIEDNQVLGKTKRMGNIHTHLLPLAQHGIAFEPRRRLAKSAAA